VISLRPQVRAALAAHGVEPRDDDTPASLKDRLNDAYLVEVRRLRDRQRQGEIPLGDYAAHAEALKESFVLLGLPLDLWTPTPPLRKI
jgi:hypothetical protein